MKRFQLQWLVGEAALAIAALTALGCAEQAAKQAQGEQTSEQAQKAPLTVQVAAAAVAAEPRPPVQQAQKGTKIQGQVVRLQGTDRFVVRTTDKREVILLTNPQTKFLLNNRAVRFADVREGIQVDAVFDVTADQNLASQITLTEAQVQAAEIVEGTVVRVIEAENQIVIRTSGGTEVILIVEDQTTFTLDNRSARLVDFRPGTAVRVNFDVKNQKKMARSVVTMPKRSR